MATRALIAFAILVTIAWLLWWVNRRSLARAERMAIALPGLKPGMPAVLYFSSPDCRPCAAAQSPALARLQDLTEGHIQVIEINALERRDMADAWGVLSLPTTFVIDSRGRPRGVNHGVVSAESLLRQFEAIEEWPSAAAQRGSTPQALAEAKPSDGR
jgi:thiol-disulfide isomerase/thioredoxin